MYGLIELLWVRVGEALGLDDSDIDAEHGMLLIRHSKGAKQRLVPIHPSTLTALQTDQRLRDQRFPKPANAALFVSTTGARLHYNLVWLTFSTLVAHAELPVRPAPCRPRLHDPCHSFAVRTLLDWYRDGCDIASRLPLLSTYLGRVAQQCRAVGTRWGGVARMRLASAS